MVAQLAAIDPLSLVDPDDDTLEREFNQRGARASLYRCSGDPTADEPQDFVRYTFPRKPAWRHNWHHNVIGGFLDAFRRGDIRRGIICTAPRHAKSEFVSRRLPSQLLGDDPELHLIHACHTAGLAQRMSRDIKRVMNAPRYGELYPETFLVDSPHAKPVPGRFLNTDEAWELPGHDGRYRAAGVGQAIAGEGADVLLIDDPVKGRKQAYSPVERENTWEWYLNDAYSRLQSDQSRVLVTVTRWHDDDLVGRILRQAEETGEKWEMLILRAEREEGDPASWWFTNQRDPRKIGELLWPSRLGPERAAVLKQRPSTWAALYQQRPVAEGGVIFKRVWLNKRWVEMPDPVKAQWAISWDLSFKDEADSDYVVGQCWAKLGGDYFFVDQVRARLDFPATCETMVAFHARFPWVRRFLVEDAANGPAVIAAFKRRGIRLIPIKPQGSKSERAHAVTPLYESGAVFLPPESRAPWLPEWITEHVRFPGGANDDQVDCGTQAVNSFEGEAQLLIRRVGGGPR